MTKAKSALASFLIAGLPVLAASGAVPAIAIAAQMQPAAGNAAPDSTAGRIFPVPPPAPSVTGMGAGTAGPMASKATSGKPAPVACPPSSEASAETNGLPHLAAALSSGGAVSILAVGAAAESKAAPHAAQPTVSPSMLSQFVLGLEATIKHVSLTQRGGRGRLAPDQLAVIQDAMKAHHYTLVVWQTGTLDAVQAEPVEDFSGALAQVADAANMTGADLVLIEPQYSHFLEANADPGPYLSSMEALSAEPGVLIFKRYAVMEDWEDQGAIDLEHAKAGDRPAIAGRLKSCLAAALASDVLAAAAAQK